MPDDLFPDSEKNKSKKRPRRWSIIVLEFLIIVAAVIAVIRLATGGQGAGPSLDAAKQYEWGDVHLGNKEYQQALDAYTAAINQGYTPLEMAYFQRAFTQYEMGNYTEAIADYTRSIELSADCDGCHVDYHNRGQAQWSLGDYDAAIQDFTQALEIKPDYIAAYVARAHIQALQGKSTQALRDVQTGLRKSVQSTTERGLAAGQQRNVELEEMGQQYRFTFSAAEGDEITFVITRATLDIVMLFETADGLPLAWDDSEGKEGGDTLNYIIEETGDYALVLASYHPLSTGLAVLSMSSTNADEDSSVADAPRIGLGNVSGLALAETAKTQSSVQHAFASNGLTYVEKTLDQLLVYDLTDETIGYRSLAVPEDYAWAVAISPDGELIAVGFDSGLILYDASSGSVRQTIRLGDHYTSGVAFSPDSSMVAVLVSSEVHIYDALGGALVSKFDTEAVYGEALAYSRDGEWLAVGLDKGLIQIWDVNREMLVRTLETGKVEDIFAVAFSPNANLIAVGGEARRVQLYDVSSGELRQTYTHDRKITDLAFSSNGQLLASASQDSTVKLWDLDSAEAVITLPHPKPVTAIEFQADGRTLLTVADDYQLRFWRVQE